MVDVNTFGTGICEDDCLAAAVRKVYDLTPAGIIKQLNLLNPITAARRRAVTSDARIFRGKMLNI